VTISRWKSQQTGLPIDFQFQRSSVANKKFETEHLARSVSTFPMEMRA
jgi:hypothetical protein